MQPNETLAYLAGLVDGDGYFKVGYNSRTTGIARPYYNITVGVQQLCPGEAVRLFATTFDGKIAKPWLTQGNRLIARSEVHGQKAEYAIKHLLPYLLVKRDRAIALLEVRKLRDLAYQRFEEWLDRVETIRQLVVSLNEGSENAGKVPAGSSLVGYEGWGPIEQGWTRNETLAYLAGIMDSDGNLRITRRPVAGMLSPHYRTNIRAAQVRPSPAIDLLAKTFGGRVTTRKSTRPNQRDLVSWGLWDRMAIPAVVALLPYLVVKTREAYLLLELRRLKAQGKKGLTYWKHRVWRHGAHLMRKRCYTPEQVAQFEHLYWELRALHSGEPTGSGGEPEALQGRSGSPQPAP